MKGLLKKSLALLLTLTMVFGAAPLAGLVGLELPSLKDIFADKAEAATYNGNCGNNLTWTFDDETGVLTVNGTGDMYDWEYTSSVPWYNYRSSIKTVVIGNSVTSIGISAFYECIGLTSITIPDSVTSIGDSAFYECKRLTSVTIPDSVTSIGRYAFEDCTGLTSIIIPDSVTTISYYAFSDCTGLISITVDGNNSNYSSDEYGVLFNKDKTQLIQYPVGNKRTAYEIPDSVTNIGNYAFSDCTGLTGVTISDSVTSIGKSAFSFCSKLTSLTFEKSSQLTSIGDDAFYKCTCLTDVYYTGDIAGWCSIAFDNPYSNPMYYADSLYIDGSLVTSDLVIPDSVTSIGSCAFTSCTSLTSVTIPDSVTSIGEGVFSGCIGLASITVPDSVMSISNDAFRICTGLTSVTIGNGVTSIGDYAFHLCSSLTSITIPDSVTSIGNDAFSGCTGLTSVTIGNGVTSIGYSAFSNCTGLTSITIPDSVTSIGNFAFYNCTGLTSVTIGNGVTSIGDYAFYNCTALTDVYYSGTEEQWNAISIGDDNGYLVNATIHYESKPTPSFGLSFEKSKETVTAGSSFSLFASLVSDNPELNSENISYSISGETGGLVVKSSPLFFQDKGMISIPLMAVMPGKYIVTLNYADTYSASCEVEVYETISISVRSTHIGKYESEVLTVGLGAADESWVSDIKIDGVSYKVNKNYSQRNDLFKAVDNYKDKEVAFVIYEDEIIWIKTIDEIESGLFCSLEFSPDSLTYLKNKYSTEKINVNVRVSSTSLSDFPGDVSVLYNNPRLNTALTNLKLTSNNKDILNFGGKESIDLDVTGQSVPFSGSITLFAEINVNVSHKISKKQEYESASITCKATGLRNGKTITGETTGSIGITNLNCSKPEPSGSQTNNPQLSAAAAELENIMEKGVVTLSADITGSLDQLFNKQQLDAIGSMLLCEVALSAAPEETFGEQLERKIIEKVFSIDTRLFQVLSGAISVTVVSKTQYGDVEVKFTCQYTNYLLQQSKFAFQGNISYEIVGGRGEKKLPQSISKAGNAGALYGTDITNFCNAVYGIAESELKSAYNLAWGNTANKAADIIFGDSVNKILKRTKYGSVSGLVWKFVTTPAKKVKIECPVDVYVYNSNNELVAAVENNQVVLTSENASISVDGDIKTVWLFDDSYYIVYRSLAKYDMRVSVSEYGFSDELLRTSVIDKIPLEVGTTFIQNIDQDYLESSDYSLTSSAGTVYGCTREYCALHEHVADGEAELVEEPTCEKYGFECAVCSICNEWFKEIIDARGHFDSDNNRTCDVCNEKLRGTKDYYITWIVDGNETFGDYNVGEEIICPTNPIKEGYRFVGWTPSVPETMPEYDMTFTAVFERVEVPEVDKLVVSIKNPSTTTINYGDSIVLHIESNIGLPDGAYIEWSESNGNFSMSVSADGTTCKISPKSNGKTVFTATVYDKDGNVISSDTQEMTSKAGLWQKIVAFFKKIFGLTKTFPEAFKGIL